MTMSEYEERFRSSTLSMHQTFAEARGPNRGRLRSRPFWLAVALVGVMSMTMNVVSHHTIQSGQVIARNYASPASDDPLAAIRNLIEGVRFAADSALEGAGFEPPVPLG
jgi:hypothetical protein